MTPAPETPYQEFYFSLPVRLTQQYRSCLGDYCQMTATGKNLTRSKLFSEAARP